MGDICGCSMRIKATFGDVDQEPLTERVSMPGIEYGIRAAKCEGERLRTDKHRRH